MTWKPTSREVDAGERVLCEAIREDADGYHRPTIEAVLEAAHAAEPGNELHARAVEAIGEGLGSSPLADVTSLTAYVESITRPSLFESTEPPAGTSRERKTWTP